MKIKTLVIMGVVVAVLAIGVGASFASAAEPAVTPNAQSRCGLGGGFRFGGAVVDEAVTGLLGMTEEEIHALRLQGESLVQIAAAKNVTEQQLIDAIMAYKETQVQDRVTAGTLTQDQAELVLQHMQEMTTQAVNRTNIGQMGGGGAGCGYGQRGGGVGPGHMNRFAR